jgi:hypothetical protein
VLLCYEDLVQCPLRTILRFPVEEGEGHFVTKQEVAPAVPRTCCKNDGRHRNGTIGSSLMNNQKAKRVEAFRRRSWALRGRDCWDPDLHSA